MTHFTHTNGKPSRLMMMMGALAVTAGCASSQPGVQDTTAAQAGERHAVYSGAIESDPAVQRAWEQGLSALEARCREAGEFCAEAAAVRRGMAGRMR